MSVWRPGAPPTELQAGRSPGDGIVWVELESGATPAETLEELSPLCPGIDATMLGDVLTPDNEPEGRSYADGQIRLASTCFITAVDPETSDGPPIGQLMIEPIEMLASREWLVSCWHPPVEHRGLEQSTGQATCDREEIMQAVRRRWSERQDATAGDLGVLLIQELALAYAPAQRRLDMWLEGWELALYESPSQPEELDRQRDALRRIWALRAVMRDWISPQNRPGINDDIEKAWLPASDAALVKKTDDRIDQALHGLAALGETLRASFSLVHMEEQEREKDRREGLQRRIELIAGVFLVPSFIVGLYGANTWVPGQTTHWGFVVMLGIMIGLTALAVLAIRRIQIGRDS